MEIRQFAWDVVDSNSWLITEGEHGLLIDAVDSAVLMARIETLVDLTVVLTHAHFDHIIGLEKIRAARPDATVIATEKCSEFLGNIYRNMSATATAFLKFYEGGEKGEREIAPFTCAPADRTFEDALRFDFCGHGVALTAVHGHSADGLVAVVDGRLLFSGDTLLSIPTVTRFPNGSSRRFWMEDVPMLEGLAGIEAVYPGHGLPGGLVDMLMVNQVPEIYAAQGR